eukprot:TRINITY_DN279_c1_g1_i2.p1 TRINITY_DN279_c1_g1~~TRINITY_DN279_c1_g1_i2.p1  ORF type:complete len:396 (+),score=86.76 TRINITY_DN279_c1_g1_i2:127-1314(+)
MTSTGIPLPHRDGIPDLSSTQEALENYLVESGVNNILKSLIAQLCLKKPEDPTKFMIQFLEQNYAVPSMVPDADDNAVRACDEGPELAPEGEGPSDFKMPQERMKRRNAISSEPVQDILSGKEDRSPQPKDEGSMERIREALKLNILFSHLGEEERNEVMTKMFLVEYKTDDVIIQQGDVGDYFYVVEVGVCDIFVDKPDGSKEKVLVSKTGDTFGELALIYGSPRAASVIASTDCSLWAIDRGTYRRVLMNCTIRTRDQYKQFLDKVTILAPLDPYERLTVADALESVNFKKGEVIVRQGDIGDIFYIIVEGEVQVTQQAPDGTVGVVGVLQSSDYFGEIALLTHRPRAATVTALCDLKCVQLHRERFQRVLGPCEDILRRNLEAYNRYMGSSV